MNQDSIFKDLKIIELASVLAGPSVGMFFAELGANVTKYENKVTKGDVTRHWKLPNETKEDVSAYFSSINYHKKYQLINYKDVTDFNNLMAKIKVADIIICNFKEGGAEKFKLDYRSLKEINSKLIYCQLNGFSSVPERVAFDVVLQAECGYMYMNGQPDSAPTKMPLALMDILAAHQLKEGVLVALYKLLKTGKGSYVSTSLEESSIAALANQASNYLMTGKIAQRIGSIHPNIAPYGELFETKDQQQVVLAIGSDAQFCKLVSILNVSSLGVDKRFLTNKNRIDNRGVLATILRKEIIKFVAEELIKACTKLGVPIGQVKNMEQVFAGETGKKMVLEEMIENTQTKRVKSISFSIR